MSRHLWSQFDGKKPYKCRTKFQQKLDMKTKNEKNKNINTDNLPYYSPLLMACDIL